MNPSHDDAYNFGVQLSKSRWNKYDLCSKLPISVEDVLSVPLMDDRSIELEEVAMLRINPDAKDGKFIARNESLGFECEYNFDTKVFPWIAVWTEHYGRYHAPWNAKQRTRGMEFATKPFPMPDLENHDALKGKLTKNNDGLLLFEDKPIEFILPSQGRTEKFKFKWRRL